MYGRRGYLTLLVGGATASSGCASALKSADRETRKTAENEATSTTTSQGNPTIFHIDRTVTVEPWEYMAWRVDLPKIVLQRSFPLEFAYSIRVRAGPNIDFFVTDATGFERMRNGNTFAYSPASEQNVHAVSREGVIDTIQEVAFILDNSAVGRAAPRKKAPRPADVAVEIEIHEG